MSTVSPYPVAHGLGQKRRKAGHRLGGDGQFHSWQQNPRERVWWVWGKNPGRHQAVREAAVLENQRRDKRTLRMRGCGTTEAISKHQEGEQDLSMTGMIEVLWP